MMSLVSEKKDSPLDILQSDLLPNKLQEEVMKVKMLESDLTK